jgi:hypothetical protein
MQLLERLAGLGDLLRRRAIGVAGVAMVRCQTRLAAAVGLTLLQAQPPALLTVSRSR